jgi:hypothetical protein
VLRIPWILHECCCISWSFEHIQKYSYSSLTPWLLRRNNLSPYNVMQFSFCFDGVGLYLYETSPLTVPLSIPQVIHEWIWSSGEVILTGETEGLGGKPVPVPLCPPQIPHGLIGERTRASAVISRWLTAWAMVVKYHSCVTSVNTRSFQWFKVILLFYWMTMLQLQHFVELNAKMILNGEQVEFGRKLPWPISMYIHVIGLERLRIRRIQGMKTLT